MTLAVIGALSTYAEILNTTGMLALCFLLSLAFMTFWHKTNRLPFDILFSIKAMIVMVLVLLVSVTINYGLDYRTPTKVGMISFRDCPNPKNEFFTNGGEKIGPSTPNERLEGCKFFYSMETLPGLDEKVETTHHVGALGIAWHKMRLVQ